MWPKLSGCGIRMGSQSADRSSLGFIAPIHKPLDVQMLLIISSCLLWLLTNLASWASRSTTNIFNLRSKGLPMPRQLSLLHPWISKWNWVSRWVCTRAGVFGQAEEVWVYIPWSQRLRLQHSCGTNLSWSVWSPCVNQLLNICSILYNWEPARFQSTKTARTFVDAVQQRRWVLPKPCGSVDGFETPHYSLHQIHLQNW